MHCSKYTTSNRLMVKEWYECCAASAGGGGSRAEWIDKHGYLSNAIDRSLRGVVACVLYRSDKGAYLYKFITYGQAYRFLLLYLQVMHRRAWQYLHNVGYTGEPHFPLCCRVDPFERCSEYTIVFLG